MNKDIKLNEENKKVMREGKFFPIESHSGVMLPLNQEVTIEVTERFYKLVNEEVINILEDIKEEQGDIILIGLEKKDRDPSTKNFFTVAKLNKIMHLEDKGRLGLKVDPYKIIEIEDGSDQEFDIMNIKYTDAVLFNTYNSDEQREKMVELIEEIQTETRGHMIYSSDKYNDIYKDFVEGNDSVIKFVSRLFILTDTNATAKFFMLSQTESYNKFLKFFNLVWRKVLTEIEEEAIPPKHDKKLTNEIDSKVQKEISEEQRQYLLRKKLTAIRDMMGIGHDANVEKLQARRESYKAPKYVLDKIDKELARLETAPASVETANTIDYLENLMSMPWNDSTEENLDVAQARKILNKDHFGLDNVKEKILEFIAVRKMSNKKNSPIICLVGPPGIGKTSIAYSIAESMNREFVKVSLGGVSDEAEIRGHRRAYVGASPGRIAKGLQASKVNNPLFLLDEIDKMGYGTQGDPSAALLEVLDPSQNSKFLDNYIEEEFDLSDVLFFATANNVGDIPGPLLDRMEVIYLDSYMDNEKLEIAKRHLIPKVYDEIGVSDDLIEFTDDAILTIIESYTMESGVRNLSQKLTNIVRKVVVEHLEHGTESFIINKDNLEKYLDSPYADNDYTHQKPEVGIVNGMAYSTVGGSLLKIEAATSPGDGDIHITGQLGDVMYESANIAYSYLKTNADKLGLDFDKIKNTDIYLNAPEGAIPKDGPSAGIAMTTVMFSALSEKPIKNNISMTGEVTLKGRVLAIGGLKEKSIAAFNKGIDTIIIPKANIKDLKDIPSYCKDNVEFIAVEHVDEVLDIVIA